jgi:hypothetical protein
MAVFAYNSMQHHAITANPNRYQHDITKTAQLQLMVKKDSVINNPDKKLWQCYSCRALRKMPDTGAAGTSS